MPRSPGENRAHQVAAAGAHDLNSELTIIVNSTASLLKWIPESDLYSRELLLEIQKSAARCADKVHRLLKHSRSHGAHPTAATIEQVMKGQRL